MNTKLLTLVNSSKQNYVEDIISDTKECFMLFREWDNKINIYSVNYVNFDFALSINASNNISGDFELSLLQSDECTQKCRELLTEYKQIVEYENRIKKLEKDLQRMKTRLIKEENTMGYYKVSKESGGHISVLAINPSTDIRDKLSYSRPIFVGKYASDTVKKPVFIIMASGKEEALEKYEERLRPFVK